MEPLKKKATYDDLCEVPDRFVAEIVDGDLYASPAIPIPCVRAASVLGGLLGRSFDLGRDGPGGWFMLRKLELHFGRDVLVPHIAGWRHERLPVLPDAAYLTLAPDWVCEVISPSTEALELKKLGIYAREGVRHAWLLHPLQQSLEVLSLEHATWTALGRYEGGAAVRAVPFEAVELDLGVLWN